MEVVCYLMEEVGIASNSVDSQGNTPFELFLQQSNLNRSLLSFLNNQSATRTYPTNIKGYCILFPNPIRRSQVTVVTTSGYVLDTLPLVHEKDYVTLNKLLLEEHPEKYIYLDLEAKEVYVGATPPIQSAQTQEHGYASLDDLKCKIRRLTSTQECLTKHLGHPEEALFRIDLLESLQAFLQEHQEKLAKELFILEQQQARNQRVQEARSRRAPYQAYRGQPAIETLGEELETLAHDLLVRHPALDPQEARQEATVAPYKLPLTFTNYQKLCIAVTSLQTSSTPATCEEALAYYRKLQALRQTWVLMMQDRPACVQQGFAKELASRASELSEVERGRQMVTNHLERITTCLTHASAIENVIARSSPNSLLLPMYTTQVTMPCTTSLIVYGTAVLTSATKISLRL